MDQHEGFFVGGFTFALFIATWQLWRETNRLGEAGERQISVAVKSADAAQRSAEVAERTLTDVERPYLFPRIIVANFPTSVSFSYPAESRQHFEITYTLQNLGRSPAILRRVSVWWVTLPKQQRPDEALTDWRETRGEIVTMDHFVRAGGESFVMTTPSMLAPFTDDEIKAITTAETRIWLLGVVVYSDIGGKRRRTTFQFLCLPSANWVRLNEYEDAPYEADDFAW